MIRVLGDILNLIWNVKYAVVTGLDNVDGSHGNRHLYLGDDLLARAFAWFPGERFFLVLIDRVERQLNIWEIDNTPTYTNYQISLDQTGAQCIFREMWINKAPPRK